MEMASRGPTVDFMQVQAAKAEGVREAALGPRGGVWSRLSWVSSQPEHNVLSVPTGNPKEENCTWPSAGCVLAPAFYSFS